MSVMEFEKLEDCLNDLGCSQREKAEIHKYYEQHDICSVIRLLRKHRQTILGTIHKEEKQISCLDYLVFQLEKEIRTQK